MAPYPNPFNESVTISLESAKVGQEYEVQIVSLEGKVIWTAKGTVSETDTSVRWMGITNGGSSVEPGLYLSKVRLNNEQERIHKIVLAR